VLLRKKKLRERPANADYVGFEIEDEFVVGYGLDFMERYRNLPCIGVLRKELIAQPK
jgi:hypoxanthine phosphoribosyltransferase